MRELGLVFSFFCLWPLLLIIFGYWLGKGAPGWPWKMVRRDKVKTYSAYEEE